MQVFLHGFVRKLHFIHVKQNVSPASDHKTQATERKIIMAGSSFGTIFQISTWGESHGAALGVVVDGCPAGLPLEAAV